MAVKGGWTVPYRDLFSVMTVRGQGMNLSKKVNALKQSAKLGERGALDYSLDKYTLDFLSDSSPLVQEHALHALGAMGQRGVQHIDTIIKMLGSKHTMVTVAVLQAIDRWATCPSQHLGLIEDRLHDANVDIVVAACMCLGSIKASSAGPKLREKLSDDESEVTEAACAALAGMDLELDAIAQLLSHSDFQCRAAALLALKTMSKADKYIDNVVPLIGDANTRVRVAAAEFIAIMGSKAKDQVQTIGKFLTDDNCGVVAAATFALAALGEAAASEVDVLQQLLMDDREDISWGQLKASGISPGVPPTLRKPACGAAAALGAIGTAAASAAPHLATCLSSEDSELQEQVLMALGSLAWRGLEFEQEIRKKTLDNVPTVAAAACLALGSLVKSTNTPSHVAAKALEARLKSTQPQVRAAACRGLGMMGEALAAPHLATFLSLFNDKTAMVQSAAIEAVVGCGDLGQMHAAKICRMMYKGFTPVRIVAIQSFLLMGARGRSFQGELETLRDDPDVGHVVKDTLARFQVAEQEEKAAKIGTEEEEPIDLGYSQEPEGPVLPVALLFPGQGSQYVKMLSNVKDMPQVKAMAERAQEILGYDLLGVCLKGPEEQLDQSKICQPAMYLAGLAALEELRRTDPDAVERKQAVAGLLDGEYPSLAAAGVFDFETGLKLVKLRGEAMQEAAEATPQMMISIAGLDRETLEEVCTESKTSPEDICNLANSLFPQGFVCAGSKPAVQSLQKLVQEEPDCLQAKVLKAPGAFNTEFMKPAKMRLLKALREAEPKMRPPTCDVYMNVTGQKITPGASPAEIVDLLGAQVTSCVEWDKSMRSMIDDGITEFYECGPMKQLKAMMKRIDIEAWENMISLCV